jgi:hypothetical protein
MVRDGFEYSIDVDVAIDQSLRDVLRLLSVALGAHRHVRHVSLITTELNTIVDVDDQNTLRLATVYRQGVVTGVNDELVIVCACDLSICRREVGSPDTFTWGEAPERGPHALAE